MNFLLTVVVVSCLLVSSWAFQSVRSSSATSRIYASNRFLEMKGRKVPIDQRGEYMKQKRMMEVRKNMESAKPEGVPVFKIFVRPKIGGLWIPCGDLAGDQRATALVNAIMAGFMTDMYKGQLDKGLAKSIFTQEDAFIKNLIENYKPFKKFTKDDLQFGYKVEFAGYEEKMGEQKVKVLEKGMEKGWLDNIKESFTNIINEGANKPTTD